MLEPDSHPLFGSDAMIDDHLKTAPSVAEETPAAMKRILVVDDNKAAALTLSWALELQGYEVFTAYDGREGLVVALREKPDIFLLDLGMPGMNGYELCRKLRTFPEFKTANIIAQTGWGQEEFRKRSREAGFDLHIVKPVDLHVLRTAIARLERD